MPKRRLLLLAAGLTVASSWCHAEDKRVPVYVGHTGTDSVGQQFVYAVREQIRGSRVFQMGSSSDLGLQVRIITLNPEDATSSNWTVASVVYTMSNLMPYEKGNPQTWYSIHLGSQVLTIGQRRTEEQAGAVVAFLDSILEKYREDARR